jgi:hypothetical protein
MVLVAGAGGDRRRGELAVGVELRDLEGAGGVHPRRAAEEAAQRPGAVGVGEVDELLIHLLHPSPVERCGGALPPQPADALVDGGGNGGAQIDLVDPERLTGAHRERYAHSIFNVDGQAARSPMQGKINFTYSVFLQQK